MTLPRSVADVIAHHVTWELEGIDRMYLNLYVPGLQSEGGVVHFFREHRGQPFASSVLMEPISKRFRAAVMAFEQAEGIRLVTFHPGERKEDIAAAHRARVARGGDRVRRASPGEDAGLPHREAPQPAHRPDLSLDRADDRDDHAPLLLRHRSISGRKGGCSDAEEGGGDDGQPASPAIVHAVVQG